jgi:hypothetical protein
MSGEKYERLYANVVRAYLRPLVNPEALDEATNDFMERMRAAMDDHILNGTGPAAGPCSLFNFPVFLDPAMPPDQIEMRDDTGRVVGRIVNLKE